MTEQTETRLAMVDGRDALAFVIIRPAGETADADRIAVEAGAHGMSKAATAYTLRHVADEFDKDAAAEGDEPIPYPAPAADAPQRLTVDAANVEAALRQWLAHYDYDAHKYTERDESTGEDRYPAEAADFFRYLAAAQAE